MLRRVQLAVGLPDSAVGPDEVADALGRAGLGVVASPVGHAEGAVGVAQEREVVMELWAKAAFSAAVSKLAPRMAVFLASNSALRSRNPATLLGSTGGYPPWGRTTERRSCLGPAGAGRRWRGCGATRGRATPLARERSMRGAGAPRAASEVGLGLQGDGTPRPKELSTLPVELELPEKKRHGSFAKGANSGHILPRKAECQWPIPR
jgi:hypothetical protein